MRLRLLVPVFGASLLAAWILPLAQNQGPPDAEPLGPVDFPTYETQILENGLRVLVLEHSEQPVISIQLVIDAGIANDPQDLPGLAAFTTELLLSGTGNRTALQIAEAIDSVGGDISTRASREAIILSASVLADSTVLAFELLRDMVLDPSFAPQEIERLRQQTASSMSANLQDPDFIADTVFNIAVYGNHPYAHPADGTPSSIQRLQRQDIVTFHETFFAPNITTLVVAGALETAEAFRLAREWFGSWEERDVRRPELTLSDPIQGRRILIIDNPESVQTEIRIGHTMVARKDPDYFPMLVARDILGGAQGRLMESLREERGLTYGAYQAFVPRKGPGSIYATTETRTERTLEAVELILSEIQRLQAGPVPEDELERVKAFLIGSFPLTIETPADMATRLANLSVYDLDADYLDTYRDDLAAITAADVGRVVRERFHYDDVLIVLLGNLDAFREQLENLGTFEVIPQSELDLDSPALGPTPVP